MRVLTPCALFLAASLGLGSVALAQSSGYTGPSQAAAKAAGAQASSQIPLMTVQQLRDTGRDDQRARLQGHIVSHVKGDHYLFEDASGRITADIDDDRFPAGQSIGPDQRVELIGEFDRDRDGDEFEVDRIILLD